MCQQRVAFLFRRLESKNNAGKFYTLRGSTLSSPPNRRSSPSQLLISLRLGLQPTRPSVPLNKASLPCPKCNALITKVTSSLRTPSGDFYRYRQCEFCWHRYKTVQLAEILAEPGDVKTTHEGHAAIINWKKVFDRVLPSLLQKHDQA